MYRPGTARRNQRSTGRGGDVEAAARAYLVELAQRYVPFVAILGVLLLLVIEAPTTRPTVTSSAGYTGSAGGYSTGAAGGTAVGGTKKAGSSGAAATGAAAPATGTGSPIDAGRQGPAAAIGAGTTPAGSTAANDIAVSGVRCSAGVRQVTWSPYAPPCLPRWTGNNGGVTARGVTASTITISYREEAESADISAMNSILPGLIPNDAQLLYDLQTYVNYFNNQYELYGRKVVIKAFPAQGDALQEFAGEDTQGAQEDAATASSLHAFADITPIPTPEYAQALVQNQVISFNNLLESEATLNSFAPYAYTLIPAMDQLGRVIVTVGCQVGSTPVSFAGDASLNGRPRVFGIIGPEIPQFVSLEKTVVNGLKACGVKVPVVVNYSIDLSSMQSEADNAISQMKASHVTTVVCACDPVGSIYVTQAADNQNYGPEWLSEWLPDQFERLNAQDQWAHSLEVGLGPSLPKQDVEAYQVFKRANPNGEPAEPFYEFLYYEVMYLFNGLQAAGPDLTPATLAAGYHSLPASPQGQVGVWDYGPDIYWPFSEAQVSYWDPTKTSAYDGKAGDFASCFGGRWFSIGGVVGFPRVLDCPGLPA